MSFSVSNDVVFTTVVTISVFGLGYVGNRLYERHKRKMDLRSLKEYFIALIDLLNEPITRQADSFITFSRRLKQKHESSYSISKIAAFNLENIKEISHFDLYELFLKGQQNDVKKKTEFFQKIQVSLRVLEAIGSTYENDFTAFMNKALAFQERWRSGMTAIRDAHDEYMTELAVADFNPGGGDRFVQPLRELFDSFVKIENHRDMHVAIDVFIRPLRELCIKHPASKKMPVFLRHAMACIDAYENSVQLHRTYRRIFLIYAKRLNNARRDLNHAIANLK